ncbi:MAG TPA: ATP-binding protein [Terriglobales bacterium]|jgi:signal transduction histidine kinase|nr:ATP-binding protein [Terriglobales bacterium]
MLDTKREERSVAQPAEEAAHEAASLRPPECHLYHISTDDPTDPAGLPPCCPASQKHIMPTRVRGKKEDSAVSSVRIHWQIKAVLPIAFVLLNGLLLFMLATVSWRDPERHMVMLVAGGGAVVICAALLVVLAFLIQRPMVELQEKIAQVGEGDLNVSVRFARRNDEIGDLGRNFNRMVAQLRESREEIQRLHRTQMSRAEHLATLGELATGLAHEIRNPLAGIAGVIEIIGRDLPATSPARAVVKEVRHEIAQINHILTDLLQTARPHPPEIRRSDLNTTVEHAVMLARQQALSKPIQIDFNRAETLPEVEHDSGQVHQVLLNLLLNAIQAIEGPGKITVEVEPHGDSAAIIVTDTGRGIPPEHLPNIFRPFYTTKGNGTGLGLSLARRIVEEHHGRIEVTSSVGQGSKFVVLLPLQRPDVETVA